MEKDTMIEKIENHLRQSIAVKTETLNTQTDLIEKTATTIINALKNGGKLFVFGNGGSAADAQHMAAELVGRFKLERDPLPVIALTTNTSIITAVSNDYSYEDIFIRQLKPFVTEKDIVLGISTSGSSANVIKALEYAKTKNIYTIALLGQPGKPIADLVDLPIIVPTDDTPIAQEVHITIIHILCKLIEEALFTDV